MCLEDGEAALLLVLVSILIRKELLLEGVFVERLVGYGGVLEDNGDAVVPATVFGSVVAGLVHPDFEQAANLHFFFQQRIMIFLEELEVFVGVSPACLVVVLDDEGLIGGGGRGLGEGGRGKGGRNNGQNESARWNVHEASAKRNLLLVH